MSKKIPVYLSEEELGIILSAIETDLESFGNFDETQSFHRLYKQLIERLETELSTFEE